MSCYTKHHAFQALRPCVGEEASACPRLLQALAGPVPCQPPAAANASLTALGVGMRSIACCLPGLGSAPGAIAAIGGECSGQSRGRTAGQVRGTDHAGQVLECLQLVGVASRRTAWP